MRYGEIITLGNHRLMCGDATSSEDVMRLVDGEHVDLVLTDPPYGINLLGRGSTGSIGDGRNYPVAIGDNGVDMCQEHYQIAQTMCNRLLIWGGQNFTGFLPPSCGWIFWDKDKGTYELNFGDGGLAYTNFNTPIEKYVYKWNENAIGGNPVLNQRVHPNQKPVELHEEILKDFTKPGDVVLDCFGGSGTTLIASEITDRKCLMMEIRPDMCDIIIGRYNSLHGTMPLFDKEELLCPQ